MASKTLFITGASSGIGAETARAAVRNGWNVGLFARSQDKLDALVEELGDKALALPGASGGSALTGEIDPDDGFMPMNSLGGGGDFGGMGMIDFDAPTVEDPVDRLRSLIEQRKSETVEILRSWLDETEEAK